MLKFLEHRIADRRLLRLIGKWLNAGVIEDGEWSETEEGTPQGATASPLLANVYLHYVFDLWADQWRRRHAHGEMIIVRFADDYIVGFEHQRDARRFLAELRGRLAKFSLELAPEKTRLIEFGRFAAQHRAERGLGRPETFHFLGFTHICAKYRNGRFMLKRITTRSGCERNCTRSRPSADDACICRSPSRASGWQAWCEDTSATTPCQATSKRSKRSAIRRPGTGTRRCGAAASARV